MYKLWKHRFKSLIMIYGLHYRVKTLRIWCDLHFEINFEKKEKVEEEVNTEKKEGKDG